MTALEQEDPGLTKRELEVVSMVSEGLSNPLIGARMNISIHTVKFHLHNAMEKLNAETRGHAVVLAMRLGLTA